MTVGLVGRKCGMTRVFTEDGASHAVTVIEIPGESHSNRVVQVKSLEKDGYRAVQVTAGEKSKKRMTAPEIGHFAKANVATGELLKEFRLSDTTPEEYNVGDELTVSLFNEGEKVDVIGVTKGRGFAGAVKRHGFRTQDATHGNSLSHRAPGSIGQCQTPGRVFKGKKMAGHMGDVQRTIQSQKVIKIDEEKGLILVKGGVPGAPGSIVTVMKAVKSRNEG